VRWWGDASVSKASGWRAARVAACWERDGDGPWLLVGDRPDGPRLFRRHTKRTWTEGLFRDEKPSGSRWEGSRVTDPVHAARPVLLMAPATYWASALGSRVIGAGRRRSLGSTRRRMLSLFQVGRRWLMFRWTQDRPLPADLSPVPS
jgi:hypothetical protein